MSKVDNETDRQELKDIITDDLNNRLEWYNRCNDLRARRLSKRASTKKYPYKGAPNFVVSIIDDITRSKTSQEISMLLNAKHVAHFMPLSPELVPQSEELACAFNFYMRYKIKARSKLEAILDTKNEIGIGIAKETDNFDLELGKALPDFIYVDPFDVIVPIESTFDKEPERIVHILRLSKRELLERGKNKAWKNTEKIINEFASHDDEDGETTSSRSDIAGYDASPENQEYYVIWEIYHWRMNEPGENSPFFDNSDEFEGKYSGSKRWVTIMSPDFPEIEIMDAAWEEDHFPFVQFRYENRSTKWFDSRGIAQILIDEQLYATAVKNMKATSLEYYGKPVFEGLTENSQNVTFEPGSMLPSGVKPIQMPQIPQQFDYDLNASYAWAEKKTGTFEQALSSNQPGRGGKEKTATEVTLASGNANRINSDAVERFNEPLQNLFQNIWKKLVKRKISLTYFTEMNSVNTVALSDNMMNILLIPAGSANTSNPMAIMQTLVNLMQVLQQSPYVKQYELVNYILSVIDPIIAKKIVANPEKQGANGGPPLEQQVMAMAQGQQQMGQILTEVAQALQKLQPDLQKLQQEQEGDTQQIDVLRKSIMELQKHIEALAKNQMKLTQKAEQEEENEQIFESPV